MFRIYGTRNVRIRGRIYFENRKNLAFDIGLKCTGYLVQKNIKFSNVLYLQYTKCVYMEKHYFENQRM